MLYMQSKITAYLFYFLFYTPFYFIRRFLFRRVMDVRVGRCKFCRWRVRTELYIPPIGTRERCRPPSEKRVAAHNPHRPTEMATVGIGYITGHLYATTGIGDEDGIIHHLYTTRFSVTQQGICT